MLTIQEVQDKLALELYGMTASEARERGICINCREKALEKCYSDAGRKEYKISGLCEQCFDDLMRG